MTNKKQIKPISLEAVRWKLVSLNEPNFSHRKLLLRQIA